MAARHDQQAQPSTAGAWWDSPTGSGVIGGAVGGVGAVVLHGVLDQLLSGGGLLSYLLAVVGALVLVAVVSLVLRRP